MYLYYVKLWIWFSFYRF